MTTYARSENATASSTSPFHLRPAASEGPFFVSGGIPSGTRALCGRDLSPGWDLETHPDDNTVGAEYAERLLSWSQEHPASPGRICRACAEAAIAAG